MRCPHLLSLHRLQRRPVVGFAVGKDVLFPLAARQFFSPSTCYTLTNEQTSAVQNDNQTANGMDLQMGPQMIPVENVNGMKFDFPDFF